MTFRCDLMWHLRGCLKIEVLSFLMIARGMSSCQSWLSYLFVSHIIFWIHSKAIQVTYASLNVFIDSRFGVIILIGVLVEYFCNCIFIIFFLKMASLFEYFCCCWLFFLMNVVLEMSLVLSEFIRKPFFGNIGKVRKISVCFSMITNALLYCLTLAC